MQTLIKSIRTVLGVAAVAGLLTVAISVAQAQGVTSGNAVNVTPGMAKHEKHPHIRAAIRELEGAKKELKEAAHDFGGHREDALRAADNAIEQLRKALEFDRK